MPPSPNGKPPEPTPASEWRNKTTRGFIVEIPSGKVIRMARSLDMLTLLRTGQVPNPLSTVLMDYIDRKQVTIDTSQMTGDALRQFMDLVDGTMCTCVLYPKVYMVPDGENPALWQPEDDDGISIVDLTQDDKNFIFSVAQGGATDLASFREQQKTVLAAMANVSGVESAPKRPARARSKK